MSQQRSDVGHTVISPWWIINSPSNHTDGSHTIASKCVFYLNRTAQVGRRADPHVDVSTTYVVGARWENEDGGDSGNRRRPPHGVRRASAVLS